MRSHLIYLVSRAVLLFLSVVAAIASMETISVGFISVTMTPSREGFLWVSIAIVLVAFATLGIKAALDWRLSYWILFPASLCDFNRRDFQHHHCEPAVASR